MATQWVFSLQDFKLTIFDSLYSASKQPYFYKIALSATLHRRIPKLLKADLIRHGSDIDVRKKYLELTPKSRDYLSKVGECVRDATR